MNALTENKSLKHGYKYNSILSIKSNNLYIESIKRLNKAEQGFVSANVNSTPTVQSN